MDILRVCLICHTPELNALMRLEEKGVPHGTPDHSIHYSYRIMLACPHCGYGLLQVYDHDCWHHYEDEDWDMYWWYALDPADLQQLRTLLQSCPNSLDAHCSCSLHTAFRAIETLYGNVYHETSPTGNARFARISLTYLEGIPALKVPERQNEVQ